MCFDMDELALTWTLVWLTFAVREAGTIEMTQLHCNEKYFERLTPMILCKLGLIPSSSLYYPLPLKFYRLIRGTGGLHYCSHQRE